MFRRWLLLFLILSLLLLDVGLKNYIVHHISALQSVSVFQDFCGISFSLEYVKNTGAAWGFFSSMQSCLLWGRCAIIVALFTYVFLARLSFWRKAALSFIITGAIGNVFDYFIYGHVVDMFHFCFGRYSFAVFNIADAMIFCGVVALFFEQTQENREKKPS